MKLETAVGIVQLLQSVSVCQQDYSNSCGWI